MNRARRWARAEKGFTLIEILIAVTIILIVTAIAVPVLFRARHSAWRTDEISNLRQLAIAGQLYADQYGEFPVSTAVLYERGYGIEQVLRSRRDPYPSGFVNAYLAWSNAQTPDSPQRPLRDYVVTYAGIGDFHQVPPMHDYYPNGPFDFLLDEYEKRIDDRQNAGWLMSIGEGGAHADMNRLSIHFRRPILRLTFEGSVIRRPNCAYSAATGELGYGPMPCFFDAARGDLELQ